jgi:hypothetical protein
MCGRVKEAKPINIIFSINFSRNSKFIKKIKPTNKIKKVIKVKKNDCLRNNFKPLNSLGLSSLEIRRIFLRECMKQKYKVNATIGLNK